MPRWWTWRCSGRSWRLIGPWEQVQAARSHLGVQDRATHMDSTEDLFELELDSLVLPRALGDGTLTGRRATEADLALQIAWRRAYYLELMGDDSDPSDGVIAAVERGELWVVEREGEVVSCSAFNATLPDCVQIGGVYTPPALRRRGYGRAAVATSLVDARAEGVERAILFTDKQNIGVQLAYESLGFRIIGEYGLVLFAP